MSFSTPASTATNDASPHPQQQQQQQAKQEESPRFKPLASISEVPSLACTSARPFTIAELEKTPPFFFTYPTTVKLKNHGSIQVTNPSHMNELLFWYRFHSGEHSDAELKGLASELDVGQATVQREEYDGGWIVDAGLREGLGKGEEGGGRRRGEEVEVKEQEQEQERVEGE